jgi:hypothetical protein
MKVALWKFQRVRLKNREATVGARNSTPKTMAAGR